MDFSAGGGLIGGRPGQPLPSAEGRRGSMVSLARAPHWTLGLKSMSAATPGAPYAPSGWQTYDPQQVVACSLLNACGTCSLPSPWKTKRSIHSSTFPPSCASGPRGPPGPRHRSARSTCGALCGPPRPTSQRPGLRSITLPSTPAASRPASAPQPAWAFSSPRRSSLSTSTTPARHGPTGSKLSSTKLNASERTQRPRPRARASTSSFASRRASRASLATAGRAKARKAPSASRFTSRRASAP
jgi:hypothetical protein